MKEGEVGSKSARRFVDEGRSAFEGEAFAVAEDGVGEVAGAALADEDGRVGGVEGEEVEVVGHAVGDTDGAGQGGRLGGIEVAGDAALGLVAVDGEEGQIDAEALEPLGQSLVEPGVAAVVNRPAVDFGDEAHEVMAAFRVGREFVVGGGKAVEADAGVLEALAVVEAERFGRGGFHPPGDEAAIGFGDGERGRGVGGEERLQGLAVEVVGVVVAGGDEIDPGETARLEDALGDAFVRLVGAGVFVGQRIREVGVEENASPAAGHEEAALPEPPGVEGAGRAGAGFFDAGDQGLVFLVGVLHVAGGAGWGVSAGGCGMASEFGPHEAGAFDHVGELLFGGPAGGLAEAAVGGEDELVGGGVAEGLANDRGDILGGFDVVAFHIDDADGGVHLLDDLLDEFEVGPVGGAHFDVHFVGVQVEEGGEHGFRRAFTDAAGLEVAEAEVGAEAGAADGGLDGAVEEVDEGFRIGLVGVAAHGGLIHADLAAADGDEVVDLLADDGQEGFGQGHAVGVLPVGEEASAEGEGAGNAGLEAGAFRGEAAQALELGDRAEAVGSPQLAGDGVLAALVVCGRAEAPRRGAFQLDAFEVAVEGEVEIEARLFAVGDDVEACAHLVVDGRDDGVFLHFGDVGAAKLAEVAGGELEPAGKGVAADDGRSKRPFGHAQTPDVF